MYSVQSHSALLKTRQNMKHNITGGLIDCIYWQSCHSLHVHHISIGLNVYREYLDSLNLPYVEDRYS